MRFKVGDPIDSRVGKKIQNLQDTFGAKDGSKRSNYIELQSAVPWIRMQSGVRMNKQANQDYLGNEDAAADALAKKYVLFGSNLRVETRSKNAEGKEVTTVSYNPDPSDINLPGYRNTENLGIRPKPGITGMQIQSHNRFGSLRTATVRFQCWSKEDMDALEVLYMRPGYSVLLEWGHSKNLRVDGGSVEPTDLGLDFYEIADNSDAVYQEIVKKRLSNHYGYDGILGTIKNFSWKFRPDGGYDCSVDLISPGELIESYKANFFLPQQVIQQDLNEEWTQFIQGGGSTEGLFPNVAVEDDRFENKLYQVPSLATAFTNFVAQARNGLTGLKEASRLMATDTTNADANVAAIIAEAGTRFNNVASAITNKPLVFLENVNELVQLLDVARKGLTVGTFNKKVQGRVHWTFKSSTAGGRQRGGALSSEFDYESDWKDLYSKYNLQIDSKWGEGIADIDLGNNITATGVDALLPDGGYIASIPVNPGAALKNLQDVFFGSTEMPWIFVVRSYLRVLFANSAKYGNIATQWEIPAYTTPDNFSQPDTITSSGSSYYYDGDLKEGTNELYMNPYGQNGSMFYGTRNGNWHEIPINTNGAQDLVTEDDFLDDWITNGFHSTAQDPITHDGGNVYDGSYSRGGASVTVKLTVNQIEIREDDDRMPFYFLPLKYKGYNPNNTIGGSTLVNTGNELQEIVPQDQYLSKLHYYLRQHVEIPYSDRYLSVPSPDEFFVQRFQYRPNTSPQDIRQFLQGNTPRNYTSGNMDRATAWNLGGIYANTNDMTFRDTVYIPFRLLLELINRHILRSQSDYFFSFVTDYSESPPQYFTFIDHISMDPRYCILPHTLKENNLGITNYIGDGSPTILDIELSINFILDTLAKYLGNDGRVSLLDFLHDLLDNMSRVCGGVNDFQLQFVEDNHRIDIDPKTNEEKITVFRSKFHIVDRKVISPVGRTTFIDNGAQLNLYGLNSIIQNIDLVSKLTPKISSMIAISAQASPYTTGEEATGFNAINKGLVDRIFTKRYEIEGARYAQAIEEADTIEKVSQALKDDISGVLQNLAYFYEYATVPPNADEQISVYENYAKFMIGASSNFDTDKRLTYSFILPFQLNLTLHGISGIKVMDAFVTSQDILPKTYGGRTGAPVAFLVTGVEHVIDREGWKTMLKTQIYNIDEDSPKSIPGKDALFLEAMKDKATGIINYTTGMGNSGRAVDLSGDGLDPVLNLIASSESGDKYDIANTSSDPQYYAISKTKVDTKTIAQILDVYSKKALGDAERVFACGRYQIIPTTLEGILAYSYVKRLGVDRNSTFNNAVQDILGRSLLLVKRSKLGAYLEGGANTGTKADLHNAIQDLAYEFASFPVIKLSDGTVKGDLDTTPDSNFGYYGGSGVNPAKVRHTITDVAKVLIKSRINYSSDEPSYNPYNIT